MNLRVVFFALGVAAITGGQAAMSEAMAQESRGERAAAAAEVPWFERFTFSPGSPGNPSTTTPGADRVAGWTSNPRALGASTPSSNWGVTFNVGEAERRDDPFVSEAQKETALGAYFRFTPRVTVGGRVSLAEQKSAPPIGPRQNREEPQAGVKLESAFRF